MDAFIGPGGDVGAVGGGVDRVAELAGELAPEHGGGLVDNAAPSRHADT